MKIFFWPEPKATGYRPGPVAAPTADGASLGRAYRKKIWFGTKEG